MKILAIESSCDETAAAVIEDGRKILSNVVVSQIDIFAVYGGVIPEVAARSHLEAILPVIHKALDDAGLDQGEIDAIAVTHTPGLMGSLMVGTLTARMLAILWQKPLYAVHHLKSHIYANWLSSAEGPNVEPQFPLLSLVISGGHTQIICMSDHNQFEIIGTTRDDAVGECFDKVAKILGLPYPGGPAIAECAKKGDQDKYRLPHPKVEGLDFSFSGLKTAVLRAVQAECGLPITTPSYELKKHLSAQQRADFAASFQRTAGEILLEKLKLAFDQHPEVKSVVFAGGVSANQSLRDLALGGARSALDAPEGQNLNKDTKIQQKPARRPLNADYGYFEGKDVSIYFPELRFSGDNAAMVGVAAYYEIEAGVSPTDPYSLSIAPRTNISAENN